jgi:diguanylate cyclase (GGDEF)-like protein
MGEAAQPAGSWLVGLMAAQFGVHAAGWAMTALMQRRADGPEGHFAAFWLALAAALALHLAAASAAAALAEGLLLLAALAVHRGLMRFYRQEAPDRLYAAALALTVLALGATLAGVLPATRGHAVASLLVALTAVAGARTFWVNGRTRTRTLSIAAAAAMGTVAVGMGARAVTLALGPAHALPDLAGATPLNAAFAIGLFFLAGLFNLAQIRLVLGRVLQHLMAQTQRDALTGVANRRGFMMALDATHRRAVRDGTRYGLLMIDIDHFKRINDSRGHAAGDEALRGLALQLQHTLRAGDTVGRLGGEEFCLLLPGCDLGGAQGLAERVCQAVAGANAITVSIGVALADASLENAEQALARADAALYRAKHEGRNRVIVSA